jgi:dTDP-4-amino-4,6-dideoxygalactose transaminase
MTQPIAYFDPTTVNDGILDDFLAEAREIFESGQFVAGPHLQRFEETFARFIGNRHCIGTGSGTDAILMALRTLGIGPTDEVLCPAFGYASTAEAIARVGATPVFVDVRPDMFTLDSDKALATITSRTRAIVPAHIFGHSAEIDRIVTIARTYSVSVIEDVRQATGAKIGNRKLGTFGDFGAFSFHPTHILGAAGEGGAITTNDDERAHLLRKLRDHGRAPGSHIHEFVGYNSVLDSLQAALLYHKLQDLEENNAECRENAALYSRLFAASPVVAPPFDEDRGSVYTVYTVLVPERERLIEYLKEKGIGYSVEVPLPMHLQPCFEYLGYKEGAFPIAEDLAKRAISLPIYPGLKRRQIEDIAVNVLAFYGARI